MDVLAWGFDHLLERYSFLSRCKQYRSFHGTIFSIFLAKSCTVAIVHTHGIGELEMHICGYVNILDCLKDQNWIQGSNHQYPMKWTTRIIPGVETTFSRPTLLSKSSSSAYYCMEQVTTEQKRFHFIPFGLLQVVLGIHNLIHISKLSKVLRGSASCWLTGNRLSVLWIMKQKGQAFKLTNHFSETHADSPWFHCHQCYLQELH